MGKISIYVKDNELLEKIKLLADYDEITLTELVANILSAYTLQRKSDLEFIRSQKEELKKRKNNNVNNVEEKKRK